MENVIAIVSMLHEPADRHSAARRFRNKPVLEWTLRRLSVSAALTTVAVLCWDDQLQLVNVVTDNQTAGVICKGPRQLSPGMQAITAARRWADGWRSGLLGTCEFDLGFHPLFVHELMQLHEADAAVLVDPASALIDPVLLDSLVDHAEERPESDLCFMQAAPGLVGTLLRKELIQRLTVANVHPGRLLTYFPDQHGVDPTGRPGAAPVPMPVARSLHRFKLDTDRQVARADRALLHLNGHLVSTEAEELVFSMRGCEVADRVPREITLELITRRATRPKYSPASHLNFDRDEMDLAAARQLFAELAVLDDTRVTLAGVGDPMLADNVFDVIQAAQDAGITAVHVETDLVSLDATLIDRLADSAVDVVSVHLPAATSQTYSTVMGADAFGEVMQNVTRLQARVQAKGRGLPLIAMIFTKTADNLSEMEAWYDYWIRRLGHAVIVGPSDFGRQIPDTAVADMAPPRRKGCARLSSRLTILSDGSIVSCEQDVLAKQVMGRVGETPIEQIWRSRFGALRQCHEKTDFGEFPVCAKCREWHR